MDESSLLLMASFGRKLFVKDIHIPKCVETEPVTSETRVVEMAEKMRKRSTKREPTISISRNDKALNNQGFVVHKMAEAMGFELMDLLQSTVFKSIPKISNFNGLWRKIFRFDCAQVPFRTAVNG